MSIWYYIASATITPLQHNLSRDNIECPGDIISYQCSIDTNSETPHIAWGVTIPGLRTLNFTYTNDSIGSVDNLNSFITTSLAFANDTFLVSTLVVEVPANISADETELLCYIQDLAFANTTVHINTSGNTIVAKDQRN